MLMMLYVFHARVKMTDNSVLEVGILTAFLGFQFFLPEGKNFLDSRLTISDFEEINT